MGFGLWDRLAAKLAIRKEKRADFAKAVGELEKAGIGPMEILAIIQLIVFLLEAAGPLMVKIKELIDALKKKKLVEFKKKWGYR